MGKEREAGGRFANCTDSGLALISSLLDGVDVLQTNNDKTGDMQARFPATEAWQDSSI